MPTCRLELRSTGLKLGLSCQPVCLELGPVCPELGLRDSVGRELGPVGLELVPCDSHAHLTVGGSDLSVWSSDLLILIVSLSVRGSDLWV